MFLLFFYYSNRKKWVYCISLKIFTLFIFMKNWNKKTTWKPVYNVNIIHDTLSY